MSTPSWGKALFDDCRAGFCENQASRILPKWSAEDIYTLRSSQKGGWTIIPTNSSVRFFSSFLLFLAHQKHTFIHWLINRSSQDITPARPQPRRSSRVAPKNKERTLFVTWNMWGCLEQTCCNQELPRGCGFFFLGKFHRAGGSVLLFHTPPFLITHFPHYTLPSQFLITLPHHPSSSPFLITLLIAVLILWAFLYHHCPQSFLTGP